MRGGKGRMKTRLTNDRADIEKAYFPLMKCPKCGYETVATNICRTCMEVMEYTGYVKAYGKRKRKYEPKDGDEAQKLWSGWAVVFED